MKKTLVLAAFLLILAASVLYLVEIETPELGEAILTRAREATGLSLSASESRFSLRRGLRLERVEASSLFPGGRYRVSLGAIVFRSRVSTLWTGRLELSEVALVEPRIEVILGHWEETTPSDLPERTTAREGARSPDSAVSEPPPSVPALLEIQLSAIDLSAGTLLLRDRGREENRLSLSDLDVRLGDYGHDARALTLIHGLTARGPFAIGVLQLESTRIEDVSGELTADRGRFAMDSLGLETPLGRFEGSVSLDFNVIPFRYRMTLASNDVSVPAVGSGALELSAGGFGTESRNMSGEGRLDLSAGEFPRSPLRDAIENALGSALTSRERATIPFRVENDRLRLERSRILTGEADLDLEGWIELDGAIELTVTTEDGKIVRLSGTLDAPELR